MINKLPLSMIHLFYIVKLPGIYRCMLFFLLLFKNIDCGLSLELPRQDGSNVYPQSIFSAKICKISDFFSGKFPLAKPKKSLHDAWASFSDVEEGFPFVTDHVLIMLYIHWRS